VNKWFGIVGLGSVVGLVIACVACAQAPTATVPAPANAATITHVQGVSMELCDEGEKVYGSDIDYGVTPDGRVQGGVSHDPNKLVLPDGATVTEAIRIGGTTSWYIPKPNNPDRADVLFIVTELRDRELGIFGQYVVTSVMACDYRYIKRITGI